METCQEHAKLTTQMENLTSITQEIKLDIKQLIITTTKSTVDGTWVKKELGKVWGVIIIIIAAIVGGAIKMIFSP